jgi:hypothetical protein
MSATQANWLQVYVDAVMEKDPYKRLALVRKLKDMPKNDLSDDPVGATTEQPMVTPTNTMPTNPMPAKSTPARVASRKVTPVKKSKSARRQ